jgi:hypothetical protein
MSVNKLEILAVDLSSVSKLPNVCEIREAHDFDERPSRIPSRYHTIELLTRWIRKPTAWRILHLSCTMKEYWSQNLTFH